MTTDTSTQAVEAHLAKYEAVCTEPCEFGFCKDCQIERDAMELLRALAAERDEFVEMVRDLRIEPGQLWNDIASARRTALEDAAKVADNFAQSPIEDDFDEGYEQAAFEIRDLIRALIKEEQK